MTFKQLKDLSINVDANHIKNGGNVENGWYPQKVLYFNMYRLLKKHVTRSFQSKMFRKFPKNLTLFFLL